MNIVGRALKKIDQIAKQYDYGLGNTPSNLARIDPESLLFYYGNIHSQRGQDGILAEIFRRIKISGGFFVEFGAWDGIYLSNARRLYEMGWSGLFIEGNSRRYKKLVRNYQNIDNISCAHDFVGAPEYGVSGKTLRQIMTAAELDPDHIDFLSIDIDGYDLEVFLGSGVKPKVVLLEGGFNFTPCLGTPLPEPVVRAGLQHPLAHIVAAAETYGYRTVCFYQDSFLVRSDLAQMVTTKLRSSLSLYSDAYYFMPDEYRDDLLGLRRRNAEIQTVEAKKFGFFRENPVDNDYLSA